MTKSKKHLKESLSTREKEIIRLITKEYSSREIAKKLYLSFETVKTHRKNIMHKLDVKNMAGLVREAFLLGIVEVNGYKVITSMIMC